MIITIEVDVGAGPVARTIDTEKLTLGFLQDMEDAQATKSWKPLIDAMSSLLKLSRQEAREITIEQFKLIGESIQVALREQTTIPNG